MRYNLIMFFVSHHVTNAYEIKRSKFIAYLFSSNEFGERMSELRASHPKARHFVYAYRELNEFEQVVENSSDDGEPRGTSGKPSLAVLKGGNLINTAVIVVRYFGGVKLGTGGLVRAYSDAVNLVIEQAKLIPYEKKQKYSFGVEHSLLSTIEYALNSLNIIGVEKNFEASSVHIDVNATQEQWSRFCDDNRRIINLKER